MEQGYHIAVYKLVSLLSVDLTLCPVTVSCSLMTSTEQPHQTLGHSLLSHGDHMTVT